MSNTERKSHFRDYHMLLMLFLPLLALACAEEQSVERGPALIGSVNEGFKTITLDANFGEGLAQQSQQPSDCSF